MQASVAYGTYQSKDFAVTNGVKQGCVLAPTLFFFLSVGHAIGCL